MALKDLTPATMLEISGAWLGPKRALFDQMPRAQSMLGDLEQAHDNLSDAMGAQADTSLDDMTSQQQALDALHDRTARGVNFVLTGLAELASDDATIADTKELLSVLFPKGISIINASYLDEAGTAKAVEASLTDAHKKSLKAINLPTGSLLASVKTWFKAAADLGTLTQQKAEAAANPPRKVTPNLLAERTAWARVVKGILSMIEFDAPPEDVLTQIEGPLNQELAKATKKRSKVGPTPEPTPSPTPGPSPTPAPTPPPPAPTK
jgi:hypothetical protein